MKPPEAPTTSLRKVAEPVPVSHKRDTPTSKASGKLTTPYSRTRPIEVDPIQAEILSQLSQLKSDVAKMRHDLDQIAALIRFMAKV
jgi:hypothetical protein